MSIEQFPSQDMYEGEFTPGSDNDMVAENILGGDA
jgi:hypothetical protein